MTIHRVIVDIAAGLLRLEEQLPVALDVGYKFLSQANLAGTQQCRHGKGYAHYDLSYPPCEKGTSCGLPP